MTWAITVSLISTAVVAYGQREAGKQQEYNLERQAEIEELSAEGEEIQRRERLNKVLAANVASASAAGITGEGSPQSLSLETARRASSSEASESLSSRLRQDMLKREGKAARKAGQAQAASTLLTGGYKATQLGK
jgi:hypothetical protein